MLRAFGEPTQAVVVPQAPAIETVAIGTFVIKQMEKVCFAKGFGKAKAFVGKSVSKGRQGGSGTRPPVVAASLLPRVRAGLARVGFVTRDRIATQGEHHLTAIHLGRVP